MTELLLLWAIGASMYAFIFWAEAKMWKRFHANTDKLLDESQAGWHKTMAQWEAYQERVRAYLGERASVRPSKPEERPN